MGRIVRARFILTLALLSLAPALAGAQEIAVTSDPALAKLQRKVAANPNSVKALVAVGYKYFELNRFQEARTVLDQARQLDPKNGVSALYSGMASEQLNDFTAAKAAYTWYLEVGKTGKIRRQITERLVSMAKDELKASAAQAVANEQQLRGAQSPATTIAVLPFKCSCADSTLLPLERGMADLIVTDLSRAGSLRVLERDRMQAIADEIRLGESAQVDAATATRAGKLIAAGSILNGQIIAPNANQINLTGAVVNTNTSVITSNPQANGSLDAIFDLE
ncbi:MAG: tetratricopeptide repeat protein [Gemmatimonadetes bacterium]|nr:tetratricopeptide repeat protein [Gemmatimonadota bacterium]